MKKAILLIVLKEQITFEIENSLPAKWDFFLTFSSSLQKRGKRERNHLTTKPYSGAEY